ncbi:MAG: sulfatase-like hydrolase/transferase, partial [Verrucomicrobiota bacterium]|nr:sulfatase-like hydrolase/transferase [Verrucomicrobiota bacterium]
MFSRTLLLVLVCFCTQAAPALTGSRPNILLIFTDDQGMHDVGTYGSEIKTPNIDSLARDGIKFTQWYVASSICTPSRYGLLTGKYPTRSRDGLLSALMFLNDKERGIQKGETIFPA